MNVWECEHPGCKVTATGEGGAIGLMAIGWYFEPGPLILCPLHHRQGGEFAQRQADVVQEHVKAALALAIDKILSRQGEN